MTAGKMIYLHSVLYVKDMLKHYHCNSINSACFNYTQLKDVQPISFEEFSNILGGLYINFVNEAI